MALHRIIMSDITEPKQNTKLSPRSERRLCPSVSGGDFCIHIITRQLDLLSERQREEERERKRLPGSGRQRAGIRVVLCAVRTRDLLGNCGLMMARIMPGRRLVGGRRPPKDAPTAARCNLFHYVGYSIHQASPSTTTMQQQQQHHEHVCA